jgi:predicted phosphoribosyltransferase
LLTKDRKFIIIGGLIVAGSIIAYIFLSFAISKLQLKFKDRAAAAAILGSPDSKENAIGAIAEDGTTYLNQSLINSLQIPSAYIKKEKSDQLKEIKRNIVMYRDKATRRRRLNLKGRTVILVDDGIATGATIIAAIRWTKKQGPKHLIVAVPVAPKQTVKLLKKEAIDIIEVVTSPSSSNFISVGQFYQNFQPITDEQVIDIIRKVPTAAIL